ncbi:phospholipase D1-like [Oscarella lobularis]|uniref:phospholipase D1-like n=1 Tax=Oscarella lobularis TaxID=121494 RepID=UPI0033141C0C
MAEADVDSVNTEIDVKAYSETEDESDSESITVPQRPRRSFLHISEGPLLSSSPFLPDCNIDVNIIGYERDARHHPLNPILYKIRLRHGTFEWIVHRRYKHFFNLARVFLFKKARRMTHRREPLGRLPGLPFKLDIGRRHHPAAMNKRMRDLERYLQKAVSCPGYLNTQEMLNFLEVSPYSFVHDLGCKSKEGVVKKKKGGHRFPKICRNLSNKCCYACACPNWKKRWLFVKDSFVAYSCPQSGNLRGVILFDREFTVSHGLEQTGIHHGLRLTNSSRVLTVQAWSKRQAMEWSSAIEERVQGAGKVWTEQHRFNSFAPIRNDIAARWFICGADYFEAVADALEIATQEIFIADWWISPELYLKRPRRGSDEWRLDTILERKARQGVRVYICLYKEVELAMNIGSARAKQYFQQLHSNIVVLRHPDHDLGGGTFLWAHHEKIVCVDQEIAFIGGLDLCFGRWDNSEHLLTDVGPINLSLDEPDGPALTTILAHSATLLMATSAPKPQSIEDVFSATCDELTWPGKDYYNPFYKEPDELDKPFEDVVPRLESPRMPWQDIGVCLYGRAARDVARHFIQRWNFTKNEKVKDRGKYPFLMPREGDPLVELPSNVSEKFVDCRCQILRSVGEWSSGVSVEYSILQAYVHCIETAEHFIYIEGQFFITSVPGSVDNDIGLALARRVERAHKEGKPFRIIIILPLLPEFEGQIGEPSGRTIHAITHWNYTSLFRGGSSLFERIQAIDPSLDPRNYFMVFGLRNHALLKAEPVTEIIYVHSKMLIVDDRKAIIGSANINDRSMTGYRDSEIAVLIEDTNFVDSRLGGEPCSVGKFVQGLRLQLFRNHLGFSSSEPNDELLDPTTRKFFKQLWVPTAARNSLILEEVFNCLPSEHAKTFADVRNIRSTPTLAKTDRSAAKEKLKDVKGHLVLMPVKFLDEENLLPSLGTAEGLIPYTTFT